MVNCTPVKLDYIRSVPISLQMGISCKIVIKELNYWWMVFLFLGPSRTFQLIDETFSDHPFPIMVPKYVQQLIVSLQFNYLFGGKLCDVISKWMLDNMISTLLKVLTSQMQHPLSAGWQQLFDHRPVSKTPCCSDESVHFTTMNSCQLHLVRVCVCPQPTNQHTCRIHPLRWSNNCYQIAF